MNAAGIDVSSRKSTIAVLLPFGEVVRVPFEVSHTAEGLTSLVQQLKAIDGETRVIMEHTGRYYEAVANVLHEAGFFVRAVNPLLIKEYGGNSLRRVKTDKADALKIARYALDNWVDLWDYTPMNRIRYDLKTLNRQFHLASKQKTATSNNLIALLEQSLPGVRKCFDSPICKDGTQKWVDFCRKPVPYLSLPERLTARSPVSYHFTVRPFVIFDWAGGGASEGIWKSILFTGLVPTKSSPFAVLPF